MLSFWLVTTRGQSLMQFLWILHPALLHLSFSLFHSVLGDKSHTCHGHMSQRGKKIRNKLRTQTSVFTHAVNVLMHAQSFRYKEIPES